MKRYRWFQLKLPSTLDTFVRALSKQRRTAASDHWISMADSNPRAELIFFWRTLVPVSGVNDAGETYSELVATVHQTVFTLSESGKKVLMRVEDPPRSLRALMTMLEKVAGFGFSVSAIEFDTRFPLSILSNVDSAKLVGMKLVNVVAGDDLVGRMEFASKSGMRIDDISFLKNLKFKHDYFAYEVSYRGVRGHITLSSNGAARVSGQLAPRILSFLEKDLSRYEE